MARCTVMPVRACLSATYSAASSSASSTGTVADTMSPFRVASLAAMLCLDKYRHCPKRSGGSGEGVHLLVRQVRAIRPSADPRPPQLIVQDAQVGLLDHEVGSVRAREGGALTARPVGNARRVRG